MRLIDADQFEVITYSGVPEGYKNTFDDGVMWIVEQIDKAETLYEAGNRIAAENVKQMLKQAEVFHGI